MTNTGEQTYEKYWSVTLAYTDINSEKFRSTLKAIIDFIDTNDVSEYTKNNYEELQKSVGRVNDLADASLRKSINTFVKLGFINFQFKSYHPSCRDFLAAENDSTRRTLFSKIVYENSSFSRDITEDSAPQKEINFLLKTLEEVGSLNDIDVAALMISDIREYPEGFVSRSKLDELKEVVHNTDFINRKYNQIEHLLSILKKLDDLVYIDGKLYFEATAEAEGIVIDDSIHGSSSGGRDSYSQRLYKNQLEEEMEIKIGGVQCMLEGLAYPTLIASHIKPYIRSSEVEAFDPNNGLLLSKNMDSLFDRGHISFEDDGTILISKDLDSALQNALKKYRLDERYINEQRITYLEYHRDNIFNG